jgi:hypothetical protein
MDSPDDITARILASIATLPLEERADAIYAFISSALKVLPVSSIYELRTEILAEFEEDDPIVELMIALIDGQVALREIGGTDGWR